MFHRPQTANGLIQDYLNSIEIPKLTKEQLQTCEGVITKEELLQKYLTISRLKTKGQQGNFWKHFGMT